MMPAKKNYSYTNMADTPQHGEIIESSYLLGEKGPKSTWKRILEVVVLLVTVGGCAYLMVFLFHSGNHRPAEESGSQPHRPVGASSASADDQAACRNHPACIELDDDCCPTQEGAWLTCCSE